MKGGQAEEAMAEGLGGVVTHTEEIPEEESKEEAAARAAIRRPAKVVH